MYSFLVFSLCKEFFRLKCLVVTTPLLLYQLCCSHGSQCGLGSSRRLCPYLLLKSYSMNTLTINAHVYSKIQNNFLVSFIGLVINTFFTDQRGLKFFFKKNIKLSTWSVNHPHLYLVETLWWIF